MIFESYYIFDERDMNMLRDFVTKQEILPLFGFEDQYRISNAGTITDLKGNILETFIRDDEIYVILESLFGEIKQKLGLLVCLTFKPIGVKNLDLNILDILYVDGNKSNIHAGNLIWKFIYNIPHEVLPEYSYIAGYSNYAINLNGDIINAKTLNKSSYVINENGYYVYSIYDDTGVKRSLGRHRALCLAWTEYPACVDKLHVNHIDGIPGNDELNNLEWLTAKGNIYHALRLRLIEDGREILVKDLSTNKIHGFYTGSQVDEYFGFKRATARRLTDGVKYLSNSYKGLELRLARDGWPTDWDKSQLDDHIKDVLESASGKEGREKVYFRKIKNNDRAVTLFNVWTEKEEKFPTITEAADFLGIHPTSLYERLQKKQILHSEYLCKFSDDLTEWRYVSPREKKGAYQKIDHSVHVRNLLTGTISLYNSLADSDRALGLELGTAQYRAAKPNFQVFPGGLQYKRGFDERPWRDPENIQYEISVAEDRETVLRRNPLTGAVDEFASARVCDASMGYQYGTTNARLIRGGQILYEDGYQFKRKTDETPWRIIENYGKELADSVKYFEIDVKNLLTGEVTRYESMEETARRLGITVKIVRGRVLSQNPPYFQYEMKRSTEQWREITEDMLQVVLVSIKTNKPIRGSGFVLTDIDTGERLYYACRRKLAEDYGVLESSVNESVIEGSLFRKKYKVNYVKFKAS